jgi:hypothetical protein
MRVEEKAVWVGFVSRDLGPQWTSFQNQKVDLDEMRSFFIQDLWYAQGIRKYGFVKGAGASPINEPKNILGSISYVTDGYRAVLWVSEESIALNEVDVVDWEIPPER